MNRTSCLTKENFLQTLASTLQVCEDQLTTAHNDPKAFALRNDLEVAIGTLKVIQEEIAGVIPQRPNGLRSKRFTRYVVDEEEQMVMNQSLCQEIMEIEDFYARKW